MVKIQKPSWVDHQGSPIFSIDVHPDGTRLATGGGDFKIILWNMLPILDEAAEKNESVPKVLSTLTNHLKAVNCVRWSGCGRFLASASDDQSVMIWAADSMEANDWRVRRVLSGHGGDVSDVAWSPDDKYVASCSLDATVIVWNIHTGEIVSRLRGHESWVKGVAWDPIGRYLASQSDDKSVIIWRTSDWEQEARITKPFDKSLSEHYFLRLGWSPDGQFLATTNAYRNPAQLAALLKRDTWANDFQFVGHSAPVVAVRFNKHPFRKDGSRTTNLYSAVGSQDCQLTIWTSKMQRPLVILRDVFRQSVLDFSWGSDGYTLACCSTDGTIAIVRFGEEEFGTPVGAEEVRSILRNLYGDAGFRADLEIPEDASQLALRERGRAIVQTLQSATAPSASAPAQRREPVVHAQREERTRDGRRRITPLLVRPGGSSSGHAVASAPPQTAPSAAANAFEPTATSAAQAVMAKRVASGDETSNGFAAAAASSAPPSFSSAAPAAPSSAAVNVLQPRRVQGAAPSARGKRKHTQVVESDDSEGEDSAGASGDASSAPRGFPLDLPPRHARCLAALPPRKRDGPARAVEATRGLVRVLEEGREVARAAIGGVPALLDVAADTICVATWDGRIHILTHTGSKCCLPVVVGAPPHTIKVAGDAVAVIACDGDTTLYNWKTRKTLVRANARALFEELAPTDDEKLQYTKWRLEDVEIAGSGSTVRILVSSGRSYEYDTDAQMWIELASAEYTHSAHLSRYPGVSTTSELFSACVQVAVRDRLSLQRPDRLTADAHATSHLEHALLTGKYLGESAQTDALRHLVLHLTTVADIARLRALAESMVAERQHERVRDEVLPIIATNPELQPVFSEIQQLCTSSADDAFAL